MKSLAAFLVAAALSTGLCCNIEPNSGVCSTDVALDGSPAVRIKGSKKIGWKATIQGRSGVDDGVYKCLEVYQLGTPVF